MAKKKRRNNENDALAQLARDLAGAVRSEGTIHLSSDVNSKAETALKRVRDKSFSIRSSIAKDIIVLLESREDICSRLDAYAFRLVLETLLLADNRNESKARGLYVLARSLYNDEHDPSRLSTVRDKKLKLLDEVFLVVLRRFCRTEKHTDSAIRWTIGLVLENMVYVDRVDVEHVRFISDRLELTPENDKQVFFIIRCSFADTHGRIALFSLLFNANDEITIAICGRVIRNISRLGVPMEPLWPRELSRQALVGFPEVSGDSQAWQSLFETFVDDGCKVLGKANSLTALHYIYALSSEPSIVGSQNLDVVTLVARDRLVVHIASENKGHFDNFLEVPSELIRGAERLQSSPTCAMDLGLIRLHIAKDHRAVTHLNFRPTHIEALSLVPLHDADCDLLYQDLVDLIPASLKVFRPLQSVTFERDASMVSRSMLPHSTSSATSNIEIYEVLGEHDASHKRTQVREPTSSPLIVEPSPDITLNQLRERKGVQMQESGFVIDVASEFSGQITTNKNTWEDNDASSDSIGSKAKAEVIDNARVRGRKTDDDSNMTNIVETFDLDMNSFIAGMQGCAKSTPFCNIEGETIKDSAGPSTEKDSSPLPVMPSIEAEDLALAGIDDLALSPQPEVAPKDKFRPLQNVTTLPSNISHRTSKARLQRKSKITLKAKKPPTTHAGNSAYANKSPAKKVNTLVEVPGPKNMAKRGKIPLHRREADKLPAAAAASGSEVKTKTAVSGKDPKRENTDKITSKFRNTYGKKRTKNSIAKTKSFDAPTHDPNHNSVELYVVPTASPPPYRVSALTTETTRADQVDVSTNPRITSTARSRVDPKTLAMEKAEVQGDSLLHPSSRMPAKMTKKVVLEETGQVHGITNSGAQSHKILSSDDLLCLVNEAGYSNEVSMKSDGEASTQNQRKRITTAGERMASRLSGLGLRNVPTTQDSHDRRRRSKKIEPKSHYTSTNINTNTEIGCFDVKNLQVSNQDEQLPSEDQTATHTQQDHQADSDSRPEKSGRVGYQDDEKLVEPAVVATSAGMKGTGEWLPTHDIVEEIEPQEIVANMLGIDTVPAMDLPTSLYSEDAMAAYLHNTSAGYEILPNAETRQSPKSSSKGPSISSSPLSAELDRSSTNMLSVDQSQSISDVNNLQDLDRAKSATFALNKALNVDDGAKGVVSTRATATAYISKIDGIHHKFTTGGCNNHDAFEDHDYKSLEDEKPTAIIARKDFHETVQSGRNLRQAENEHGKGVYGSREISDSTAMSTYVNDDVGVHLGVINVHDKRNDIQALGASPTSTARFTRIAESGSPMITEVCRARAVHHVAKRARFGDELTTSRASLAQPCIKQAHHKLLMPKSTNMKLSASRQSRPRLDEGPRLDDCKGMPRLDDCKGMPRGSDHRAVGASNHQQPFDSQSHPTTLPSRDNPFLADDASTSLQGPRKQFVHRLHKAYIQNEKAHHERREPVGDRQNLAADPEKTLVNDDSGFDVEDQEIEEESPTSYLSHKLQHAGREEQEWFDALKPFYVKETQLQLMEVCNTLIRHLIKKEVAIKDIVTEYRQGGCLLFNDLNHDYRRNKSELSKAFESRLKSVIQNCKSSQALLQPCIEQARDSSITKDEAHWQKRQSVLQTQLQHARGNGSA